MRFDTVPPVDPLLIEAVRDKFPAEIDDTHYPTADLCLQSIARKQGQLEVITYLESLHRRQNMALIQPNP